MTLLFAILTKNASSGSCSTFVYLLRAHILNINMRAYITSAHGHELSRCVRVDAYNLILIFASYCYAPWPWPCISLSDQIQVEAKSIFVFWGCWSRHSDFPGYERDVTRISRWIALRILDLQIHALNSLSSRPRA